MKRTIVILIFLSFCTAGWSSEFWVDTFNGSDSNTGFSREDAWQTVTYALTRVSGDESDPVTINLAEGVYNPSKGEIFPFEINSYISVVGIDREKTILDADETGGVIYCEDAIGVKEFSFSSTEYFQYRFLFNPTSWNDSDYIYVKELY